MQVMGGCTALVATIHENKLSVANLGDSRLVVFRKMDGQFSDIYHTPMQQHYFNCPFQFASEAGDPAQAADLLEFDVEEGDLVVTSTDGMWDNLFVEDIAGIINESSPARTHNSSDLSALSQLLSERTTKIANNPRSRTPFAQEARKHNLKFRGGKVDDVTIICSVLVDEEKKA